MPCPGFKKKSFRTICSSTLPAHSDGAARRVSERIESCFHSQSEFLLHDLLACPSRVQDESGLHGTTRQRNTHNIESREGSYLWHPWYARAVAVHETLTRNGRAVFQCGLDEKPGARLLEIPQWMFDSVACCRMSLATAPTVSCGALLDLKALLRCASSAVQRVPGQSQSGKSEVAV